MKKIRLYFLFYKSKFTIPLAVGLFALYASRVLSFAILLLSITTLVIWFYQYFINDKKKKSLYFYYNLGLTELQLYLFTFLLNTILLIGINSYIK